jgi:hypothetical protein
MKWCTITNRDARLARVVDAGLIGMYLKLFPILFVVLITHGVAATEFSVRCEGGKPLRPYFATFDTDARRVVFESAPSDVVNYVGSNVFAGDINGVGFQRDERIGFSLWVPSGTLSLVLDLRTGTMIWPGLDDLFRPTLKHPCSKTAPRSILSFRSPVAINLPITVRCQDTGYGYFTIDVESKRAIFDRGGGGSLYEGEVTSSRGDEIDLLMQFGGHARKVRWSSSSKTLTMGGIAGDKERPTTTKHCEEIAPRTMIEYYKMLRPG